MKIIDFKQAEEYLLSRSASRMPVKYQGGIGLERTKGLLRLLGDPQNKLKVIHVAGTSGKGSTVYFISLLLCKLGFKTTMSLSPHLLDIRERIQINNHLINEQKFIYYLNKIIPAIEKASKSNYGELSFFEIIVSLVFYVSYHEKVDYLVIETGLGGLFDATNCVGTPDKVVVLTKIGVDHKRLLGSSTKQVAFHKAGIIQHNNIVFSAWQRESARKVIEKIAYSKQAEIVYIRKRIHFKNVQTDQSKVVFDYAFPFRENVGRKFVGVSINGIKLSKISVGLSGEYQAENASLALAVVISLSQRDKFEFKEDKIRTALQDAYFVGRLNIFQLKGKKIILDGAHNPQKMNNFIFSIKKIFPKQKFDFIVAFKKGKDYLNMLRILIPMAKKVYITQVASSTNSTKLISVPSQDVIEALYKLQFHNIETVENNGQSMQKALHGKEDIIVTGSLYLLADIYPLVKKYV